MRFEHSALFADRRGEAIEFRQLLWSSAQSPWSGFPLERARIPAVGVLKEFAVPEMLLGLCVAGSAEIDVRGTRAQYRLALPGTFALLARGDRQDPIAWRGAHEILYLTLGQVELRQLIGHDIDSAELSVVPQYAARDPHIMRLLLSMHEEVLAGCPTGRIYGESLSLALASYVLASYSRKGVPQPRPQSVFSSSQASHLRDYLRLNLKRDVTLTELAQQVGLSSHYFSVLFKNTFGTTPHHYLLCARVREGQQLLTTSRLPICEVALELGFSDQSHFTQVFRKLTGLTPRRYRRTHLTRDTEPPPIAGKRQARLSGATIIGRSTTP